jgi:glycosyltransferase involved in cell wall biosynthesis
VKTIHIAYSFAPDPIGGTEVYVEGLCRELEGLGVEAVVAAPATADAAYAHRGLRVRRFGTGRPGRRLTQLYGAGDPVALRAFERLLDDERPDLVHQHAVSPACSVELMRAAERRGRPVVFTYHTPAVSCARGTLLRWGAEVCDGALVTAPCTACALDGLGAGRLGAAAAGRVPPQAGEWLGRLGLRGGMWTAARMTALMRRHHASVSALFSIPARIVALTSWVAALLEVNGVPASRIVSVPHGTSAARRRAPERRVGPCRFVHLGRLDPVKGTDLLLAALRGMSSTPCELDIMGMAQGRQGGAAQRRLEALAAVDSRVRFLESVDPADVVDRLAAYDVMVVPSQWLETGPLVALEAFAAGLPVIGSALGGLSELIVDHVNGLLVRPFQSVPQWTEVLRRVASDRPLRDRLRAGVVAPRTMAAVAHEMRAVYEEVLGSRPLRRPVEWVRA